MEKYIISLLEQNKRVIVPDLGAFIIRQNEPKDLVFNDLLAFDDGMLTDKLMLEENILKAEAQSRIKQFVEKARRTIETGEVYPIEELGFLRMDATSRIEFLGKDVAPDAGKKETTSADKVTDKATEDSNVEVPDDDQEAVAEDTDTPQDASQSDYETEYMKLMNGGKKTKKKKPQIVIPEPEPEAEPESEPEAEQELEPVAEVEPEAEPETETETEPVAEPESEPEAVADKSENEPEEGFTLAEGDEEIEVDATKEETPLQADNEESRFHIDEDGEKSEITSSEDSFSGAIAEELGSEPEIDPDLVIGEEIVSETSAIDQARAAEEARAIAEERAAMLAARQKESIKEKPVPTYSKDEDDYKKKRGWLWILGIAAVIIIVLAIGWFMFPEKVDKIMSRDNVPITMGDQSQIPDSETMIADEQEPEPESPAEGSIKPAEAQPPTQEEVAAPGEEEAVQPAQTTPEPAPVTKPAGKQYYIVAGSFANLGNAENFVRTLKSKGFNASVIGKRNNLYTVCFNSHATKRPAEEELARIRKNNDAQAWLLYY